MVLQKVAEEGHLELTDTLIDDNNTSIKVSSQNGLLAICKLKGLYKKLLLVFGNSLDIMKLCLERGHADKTTDLTYLTP